MSYEYLTSGVCARSVSYDIVDGKLRNVRFVGGCDGNLKAIGKLVEGMPPEQAIAALEGNTCGRKSTSCGDQFAQALKQTLAQQ